VPPGLGAHVFQTLPDRGEPLAATRLIAARRVHWLQFASFPRSWTEHLQVAGTIRWYGGVSADVRLRHNGHNGKNLGNLDFAWSDVDIHNIPGIYGLTVAI
jgi:hypothetical protein